MPSISDKQQLEIMQQQLSELEQIVAKLRAELADLKEEVGHHISQNRRLKTNLTSRGLL